MASSFRRALLATKAESDVIALWTGARSHLCHAEHVETLYHIGKLVQGRTRGSVRRVAMDRADAKQGALRNNPTFYDLVNCVGTFSESQSAASCDGAHVPEDKVLCMALLALGHTHEDMTTIQSTMANAQLDWFIGIVCRLMGACYHSLHRGQMSTRCLANALHALSSLQVYDPKFFTQASTFLAHNLLGGNEPARPWVHLQQWLHASVNLNHRWDTDHYARLLALRWSIDQEATQRLFQLCLNVCCLGDGQNGDPLLARLISEVNHRASVKKSAGVSYDKMSSSMIHAAQHCRILVHNERLSAQKFAPEVVSILDAHVAEPGREVSKGSRFEHTVAKVLRQVNVRVLQQDVRVNPFGLCADFLCEDKHGVQFYCEIDGPSHFLVVPKGDPRGRLILKKRLFRALNLPLLSVPYWMDIRRTLGDAVRQVTRLIVKESNPSPR